MGQTAYSSSSVVGSSGQVEIDLSPPGGYYWQVLVIAVTNLGANTCTCQVYIDQQYQCGTSIGNGDTADGNPIQVNQGQQLRMVWAGASPGSICTVNIQVNLVEIGS